jgi:hypothetical protein
MPTVDFRTRFDGDVAPIDPATFLEQVGGLSESRRAAAGHGATRLGLGSLTLEIDNEQLTFTVADDGGLTVRPGRGGVLVVKLGDAAFSDLIEGVVSTFWLILTGRAEIVGRGGVEAFADWEPVLRCLLDGRAVYEPGSIHFADRCDRPLDLHRSFTLDDDPADIGHFLAEAGFLHIERVFTESETAAVSAELADAMAAAEPDDGASWWARTASGEQYPARILGFNLKSPALRELLHSQRFTTLGTFTDDRFVQRDPDVGDSAEGLFKRVGVVEGISDVSWHKDCTPGGHSRQCCRLVVGISVTGAGRESGELGVVAGSHRANLSPVGVEGIDLPRIALPTNTGDVTVHCSCTLHMSRPPVSAQRSVVYSGFSLARRPGDHPAKADAEEIRRDRVSQNDHVRRQQQRGAMSARIGSHEL